MDLIRVGDLFNIRYGNSLDLTVLTECEEDNTKKVNYISRTRENNGISAHVEMLDDIAPFPPGLITVAGSGNSVLESFLQTNYFYTGYHVFVLEPLEKMTDMEKLFYCFCIKQNQYKYSYGRQANKTLMSILVPKNIPTEFSSVKLDEIKGINAEPVKYSHLNLDVSKWCPFRLVDLFDITGTKTTPLDELKGYGAGEYPYVTTQATNNGVQGFFDYFTETGNVLTIDSAVLGYCSYQPENFSASDHVEKLVPKFTLNKYIALFLTTILNKEQYRYNYGRKSSHTRMEQLQLRLPCIIKKQGAEAFISPDYQFMEDYIKSLKYSDGI